MKESTIQSKILRWLEKEGIWCVKYEASASSRKGTPDILCCVNGRLIGLETKRPGKGLEKLQEHERKRILKSGGISERVDCVEDVQRIVEEVRNGL